MVNNILDTLLQITLLLSNANAVTIYIGLDIKYSQKLIKYAFPESL